MERWDLLGQGFERCIMPPALGKWDGIMEEKWPLWPGWSVFIR